MSTRRVVITGVGPVSAIGIGREAFSAGLNEGRSGIGPISSFDTAKCRSKLAAEIRDFNVADYLESQKTYLDRASELSFAAMSLAIEDANLDLKNMDRSAIGLMLGSAYGCLGTVGIFFDDFIKKGPRLVKPVLFPHAYTNTSISLLAIEYSLSGYHVNFSSGSVSSACAVVEAYDVIRQGRVELAFAGGYEAFSQLLLAGHEQGGLLSPGKGGIEKCAPFDRNRNGAILGEGAGILVLEELEHAKARGANILGEVVGTGMSGGSDPADTMKKALGNLTDLDLVLANANGSDGDMAEAKAIKAVAGNSRVPVTTIKPLTGETLGAGGALQMIAGLNIIQNGFIPPTLNLATPADGIDLNIVGGNGLKTDIRRVLTNSVDQGGSSVSVVLQDL